MKHNEIKIAIVEDHRLVRNGLKELIHMLDTPFRVVMEAADGGELLDAIAATGAQDLCILDIQMTGMDGSSKII